MAYSYGRRTGGRGGRLLIALVIAGISVASYLSSKSHNEVTGETQYVDLTPDQEIALGLSAAPDLIRQFGGDKVDPGLSAYVTEVGTRVVKRSAAAKSPYSFRFHVLNDPKTINAFALPGGQVFITTGLLKQLTNEAQLAGVLGHEVGHVVGRHGAEHLAKQQLTAGLGAAFVVGADDPNSSYDHRRNTAIALAVGSMVNMKFGRSDELESDALGVRFMSEAGYDPNGMIGLMKVLQSAGGGRAPEFFSTHPNPENRLEKLAQLIAQQKGSGAKETNEDEYRARALAVLGGAPAQPRMPPRGEPLAKQTARVPGVRVVPLSDLPVEARATLSRIRQGGPYPFDRDGIAFENREGVLPAKEHGYYREFTVTTPGSRDRGARRIVSGQNGELFYTADHYQSFVQIDPES